MPIEVLFRSDMDALPLQAADMTAGLRKRTLHRENDQFDEWLWKELQGFVNVSEFSGVLDRDILNDDYNILETPEGAMQAWAAVEAYLDTFGGDPIKAFNVWAEMLRASRKPKP